MLSKVSKALSSTPIPQYFNKAANKVGKVILCEGRWRHADDSGADGGSGISNPVVRRGEEPRGETAGGD